MRVRSALALVCVATFLVYTDTSITPVAVPAIDADLGAGPTVAQWLLNAYTLAFACLLLTAGSLGDRLGRRPVLVAGTAGFTLASVVCALAPDTGTLIAGRAAQGLFAAAVVPLSLAVAGSSTDARVRARAIAVWGGTCGVALALGPLLGGVLVETAGWRSIFWINAPIGVIAVVGLWWALPAQAPPAGTRRFDVVGQVLFLAGGAGLTFALTEGRTRGWGSPLIVALLAGGVVALVAFVLWERRHRDPMLPPRLLRIPAVAVACGVNFLGLFGVYAVLYLLTVHLQQDLGLSPLAAGLRFLALFGCLGVGAVAASWVAARLGTRPTMVLGLGCVATGLAGLTLIDAGVGYAGYFWALALLGVGVPLSSGVVAIQAMMGVVPPELRGTSSGAMNTFRQFGAVFGVAMAGILSPVIDGVVTSMHVTFLTAAVGAAVAAVLTAVVLRPVRDAAPAAVPVPSTARS